MEEGDKNKNDDEIDEIEKSKYVEFYSQSYASFYNTTIEKDKSILTISAGGIGFLITFISISKSIGCLEFALFLFSSLSFVAVIFTILHIFGKNAEYIIALTTESDDFEKIDIQLKFWDKIATYTFIVGIILSIILGAGAAYKNLNAEDAMSIKKQVSTRTQGNLNESMAGANTIKRSFTGASKLKPTINTPTTNNSGNSTQSSSTSSTTANTSSPTKKD